MQWTYSTALQKHEKTAKRRNVQHQGCPISLRSAAKSSMMITHIPTGSGRDPDFFSIYCRTWNGNLSNASRFKGFEFQTTRQLSESPANARAVKLDLETVFYQGHIGRCLRLSRYQQTPAQQRLRFESYHRAAHIASLYLSAIFSTCGRRYSDLTMSKSRCSGDEGERR